MHLLVSGPSGLGGHAIFALFNIDSISIQPMFLSHPNTEQTLIADSDDNHRTKYKEGSKLKHYPKQSGDRPLMGIGHIAEMLFGLLYISNNLQEELHHSHFYYLLMGSRDFTVSRLFLYVYGGSRT